jgi:hypothetical protein
VSISNEPIDVLLQAAAQYGVTFLVLDINHPKPLAEIFEKAEEMVDFPKITFVEQYYITDLEGSTLPVYLYRIEP